MMRLPILIAGFLLTAAAASAGGSPAGSPDTAACRAALDRDVARLEQERKTIKALFEADTAANEAAAFKLQKAEKAILADLAAEQADAEARYASCRSAARR